MDKRKLAGLKRSISKMVKEHSNRTIEGKVLAIAEATVEALTALADQDGDEALSKVSKAARAADLAGLKLSGMLSAAAVGTTSMEPQIEYSN